MNSLGKRILWILGLGVKISLAALITSPYQVLADVDYALYPSSAAQVAESAITLFVPPEGRVSLILTRSGSALETIDLFLSTFADTQGNLVEVKIGLPQNSERESAARLDSVLIDRAILLLRLEVPELPTPGNYDGYLFLSRDTKVLASYKITLTRTKVSSPATLVLDQQALTLPFTRPFWGQRDGPEFTVVLREASREWELNDLFARLVDVQASQQSFDPKQQLTFSVNGGRVSDFWSLPPADIEESARRRIRPGEQASVHGVFHGVSTGEYTTKLRFLAVNSQEDDRQELTLTLRVRDSIWWAVFALTFAIVFSFFSNKWLKTRRRRLEFRKRLSELRPFWLWNEPPNLSVVSVRAIFRQTEDRSRTWLLSGSDVIDARVTQATEMLKPLDRVRKIRRKIERLDEDPMVIRRAEKVMRGILADLGSGPLGENLSAQINSDLTELDGWFQPGQLKKHYGANLERDIARFLARVRPDEVTGAEEAKVIRDLITKLEAPVPTALSGMVERERTYAKLKIIWERRREEEFGTLIKLCAANEPPECLFEEADKQAWQRLKKAANEGKFRWASPRQSSPEPLEAYQPLRFEVAPENPELGENYLFKHALRYEWHFTLEPSRWWRKFGPGGRPKLNEAESRQRIELTPVTQEPRVVQYAPKPGKLRTSVKIYFGDDTLEVEPRDLQIAPSSDFRWQRAFGTVELGAVFVAWALAIASGLLMFYVDSLTFGSAKDYLTLLLWGAGADQTKNFLQTLESYSGSSPATAATAG